MNILLIGGSGSLMNQMIIKLNKEGHRIYLLTGNQFKTMHYERVFETYYFPYDSDCLGEIFESVNPDVTLFFGACDTNFRWQDERRELVRFTSSLTNILTAYSMNSQGRFIYLSSGEVHSGYSQETIPEETPTMPARIRGMALAQGEEICENYRRTRERDVVVLRLDNLYSIPADKGDCRDICTRMCLEALRTGTVTVNEKNRFSLLYESDAVKFIYDIISCHAHSHAVYNLSSSAEMGEMELAERIQEAMGEGSVTIRTVEAAASRCILSNQRFNSEFGMRFFGNPAVTVGKIVTQMKSHSNHFLSAEQIKVSLGKRIVEKAGWAVKAMIPFIENMVCFIPFFMLNNRATGSDYFSNLDFYLIYVLLFAIVYGQQQATFSAVLAVMGYCFRQMYNRSGFEVMLDYNTYVWIAQLFILGLVVGYMKDQIRLLKMESEEERQFLSRQLTDIQDINNSNVRVKDALELEIVNHNDSIGKIYSITSRLEQYMPEEVLFYAAETLANLMGSESVAIYVVSNSDYARLFSFTSEKAKMLGKSIRYRELGDMYQEMAAHKVYINRKMDERYPLMANAIFEEDQIQMMIMIWGIPWERMTLGQANFLVIVSYLIQNAILHANRYLSSLETRRYQEDHVIMETAPFQSLTHAYLQAKDKNLTECAMLQIMIPQEQYAEAGQKLKRMLRQSDYLGTLKDGKLYALLSNTSSEDSSFVRNRMRNEGFESRLVEDMRV